MATVPAATYVSPEEYLERERQAEFRSEYRGGEIFAMAGAKIRHARIVTNLVRHLGNRLAGGGCSVFSTDVKLHAPEAQLYTYPDVMVICGEPSIEEDLQDIVTNPTLIVEVLSKSTQNYDRGEKFEYYRTLASLREYLTVAQDRIHVEQHVKQPSGQWLLTEFTDKAASIVLSSLGVELPLSDVYGRVQFQELEA